MHTKFNQGEHFLIGTDVATIKATGDDASNMRRLEVTIPPGGTFLRKPFTFWKVFLKGVRGNELRWLPQKIAGRRIWC